MTPEERFQLCQEQARRIVAAYRAEAPEGCDPQNTWAALAVGTVVAVGGAAYSANQSKKAAKTAAGAKPVGFTPELLDDPKTIDPMALLQGLHGTNAANFGTAQGLSRGINRSNYQEALKYLRKIQPGFDAIQAQTGQNALAYGRGELPADVQGNITRMAAERGIQGGYGFGSQGAGQGALANSMVRNLGLTSLDLSKYGTQLGMQVNSQAKALLPNLSSVNDWLLNPAQALGIAQFNTGAQNQFDLQNNQTINNAMAANVGAQNTYNQNVAYANATAQQMQGQAWAQAAGTVGGTATQIGLMQMQQNTGASNIPPPPATASSGQWVGNGSMYGLPTNAPVYRPQLA